MTTRQIDRFAESVGLAGKGYDELWCWSVEQPAAFWRGVWDFYGLSDRAADADQEAVDDRQRQGQQDLFF